ncbi:DUF2924 domain-containing protein [Aurantimonas aggregata]|uniref:DUF2924 domain-containing protein n=1 Tax=Aurantimonas aggregata TaxID=2047720 RepID=A0A6L9ME47_9HYPH|nr:DUF2924 domain-containing protein [Aurantimonas aggregata]NDV85936.1 DUF2924 domain-containing protein [Aurantimonas aggregata]
MISRSRRRSEASPVLDLGLLRSRWLELYGTEAPIRMSRELLIQAIAYRLQENAIGGLSAITRAALTCGRTTKKVERARIDRRVKAGTRFVRQWQGRTIEVAADGSGGYLYRGRTYRSLSAIAREITGTRWSGPAFFGLTVARESKHGSD